jgi:ABC-2 type transport system ATP-binding protein
MLELIERIGTEFGISIVVASHLLSEIERVCDHLVAIEGGQLLRADTLSSFTGVSQTLVVEVDEGAESLLGELARRGLTPRAYQRTQVLIPLGGSGSGSADEAFDVVIGAVADLRLPLSRLEQRRHQVEELFRDESQEAGNVR